MIEHRPAAWKNVAYYVGFGGGTALVLASPLLVAAYMWSSLSGITVFLGAVGVGALLVFQPVLVLATCKAVLEMYAKFIPAVIGAAKKTAPKAKPKDGKYYWDQASGWGQDWESLEIASTIMFSVGIACIALNIYLMFKSRASHIHGYSLLAQPVLAIVGVAQYHSVAQHMPPKYWHSGADGEFDWAYQLAVYLVFASMVPALLEVNRRQSFRLWEPPSDSTTLQRTGQLRNVAGAGKKRREVELV